MKYLIPTLLLLVWVGCKSNPTQLPDVEECNHMPANEFFPLTLGTYWVYNYYLINSDTVDFEEVRKTFIKDTLTYTVNNQKYSLSGMCKLFSSTDFMDRGDISYFHNKPDGLYNAGFIFDGNQVIIESELLYKYPVNVGDNWPVRIISLDSVQDSIIYLETVKYQCVATDVLFITPFDTFSTVVYGHSFKQAPDVLSYWHYFDYFTSGIGRVGTEIYASPDSALEYEDKQNVNLQIKEQLTDYCLKVY